MATKTMSIQANSPMELESTINGYIAQGFAVANRSPNQVTLIKHKEFSVLWAVIGFFFCLLPLLIYLVIYATQKDEMILINLTGAQPTGYAPAPQLNAPATAPRSPDGNYWWDGQAWQPVQALPYGGTAPSTPYPQQSQPYPGQQPYYGDQTPQN